MELTRLKEYQLTLLGQLEAARLTITLHLDEGKPSRDFWITGEDLDGQTVLLWNSRTGPGPWEGINLAELMTALMEIFRLTRADTDQIEF